MKRKYSVDSLFFVVFALNERNQPYQEFKLATIRNTTLGLFNAIYNAPNNVLSDGEIAEALLESITNLYSDLTHSHCLPAIINWYLI